MVCPHDRLTFYASGRYWVFLVDGYSEAWFTSSLDNSNWNSPTNIGAMYGTAADTTSGNLACWYDPTTNQVSYVRTDASTQSIYYRLGTPNSDGSITWAAAEQTALHATGNKYCWYPVITVDSNGYPWISYNYYTGSGGGDAYVSTSTTNNGVWTTAGGYPYKLSSGNNEYTCSLTPMASGKIMAVYGTYSPDEILARIYDGSGTWGAESTLATDSPDNMESSFSVVAYNSGTYCMLVYVTNEGTMKSLTYSGGSWSAATSFSTDTQMPYTCPTTTYDPANNKIYAFWLKDSHDPNIYSSTYDIGSGTWSASDSVWYTDQVNFYAYVDYPNDINSYYQTYNNVLAVAFMDTGASQYYRIRSVYQTTPTPLMNMYSLVALGAVVTVLIYLVVHFARKTRKKR